MTKRSARDMSKKDVEVKNSLPQERVEVNDDEGTPRAPVASGDTSKDESGENAKRIPEPLKLVVRARGLKKPEVDFRTRVDAEVVHITCTDNAQFWCEVEIPLDSLLEMVNRVAEKRPSRAEALRELLATVRETFNE